MLIAVALFQPVTRGEISEMLGREISRDLIAAGPRNPRLGAPYAYVTTDKFLSEFGFESLGDLPDLAALKEAGRLADGAPIAREGREPSASTGENIKPPDAPEILLA